tara:strand:+ start:1043 stop:2206 length:1164 start_codon:yes stop_codon:yes gene_type:complete
MDRKIFNEDHKLFRESIVEWIEKDIVPNYNQWENDKQIPREAWKQLGELGGLCPMAKEQYGGLEGDFLFQTIVTEELAYRACSGLLVAVHNDLVYPYIEKFSTKTQCEKWIPKMISGEIITGLAMTEPGVGSNLAGITTKAVKKGNKYIVNGAKTFISNGQTADLFIVAVRTSEPGLLSPDPRKGISMLAITSDTPGFARGRNLDKIGFHSQDTSELFFQDAEVPVENLIGEEGKGWVYMMENLQTERIALAVGAVAAARGTVDITKEYVQTRKIFGKPVAAFQNTKFQLAECATDVEIGQAFMDDILVRHMKNENLVKEVSMAKYWCTDMQFRVADKCLQLFGGYGYMKEYPISRFWTDSRVQRIYGGSNEVMKVIIAQQIGLSSE